jgi:hypothetical protein
MAAITRNTDKKGRITLPKGFADHLVIIEQVNESEVRIRKAHAIPVDETWLWENRLAGGKVLLGLREAQAGTFADGPDLEADSAELDADDGAAGTR